jgi:hypothetical protein
VQENVKNQMRPPTLTEHDKTREKHDHSRLLLSVAVSVACPVKTVISCNKDGERHNGWTTTVFFLAGEHILSSHYQVVENSKAQDSVQWCQRFLTQSYSSQNKMLIT